MLLQGFSRCNERHEPPKALAGVEVVWVVGVSVSRSPCKVKVRGGCASPLAWRLNPMCRGLGLRTSYRLVSPTLQWDCQSRNPARCGCIGSNTSHSILNARGNVLENGTCAREVNTNSTHHKPQLLQTSRTPNSDSHQSRKRGPFASLSRSFRHWQFRARTRRRI